MVRKATCNEAFESYFDVKVLETARNFYGSNKEEVDLLFVLLLASFICVSLSAVCFASNLCLNSFS